MALLLLPFWATFKPVKGVVNYRSVVAFTPAHMTTNMNDDEFLGLLETFAKTISRKPFGLVKHRPELYAQVNTCFHNTEQKVARSGGRVQYGWMFLHRYTADFSSVGYFIATHHAVWFDGLSELTDVTPFNPDTKHQPIHVNGSIFFLVDDKAKPVQVEGQGLPLPNKYYPLNNGKKLKVYVDQLIIDEQKECEQYYEQIAQQARQNPQ